jgi:hypothetical protein
VSLDLTAFARDSAVSAAVFRTSEWIEDGTRIPKLRLPALSWFFVRVELVLVSGMKVGLPRLCRPFGLIL